MQTLKIDIINDKAMRLLQDMELLKLIRLRNDKDPDEETINLSEKYKGAMQKQQLKEVDKQLNELRESWE